MFIKASARKNKESLKSTGPNKIVWSEARLRSQMISHHCIRSHEVKGKGDTKGLFKNGNFKELLSGILIASKQKKKPSVGGHCDLVFGE